MTDANEVMAIIVESITKNRIDTITVGTIAAMDAIVDALYEAADEADLDCDSASQPEITEVWAWNAAGEQVWRVHIQLDATHWFH